MHVIDDALTSVGVIKELAYHQFVIRHTTIQTECIACGQDCFSYDLLSFPALNNPFPNLGGKPFTQYNGAEDEEQYHRYLAPCEDID